MLKALRAAIGRASWSPSCAARPARRSGSRSLLDLVIDSFPSPADRPRSRGPTPAPRSRSRGPPAPRSRSRRWSSRPSPIPTSASSRCSASSRGRSPATPRSTTPSRETRERVGQVALHAGQGAAAVESLGPGEIGVVAKLKETLTGDTLCAENAPVMFPPVAFPEPAISFALQPKAKGDEDKISNALARLAEEDPTLRYHYDPETRQLLISGVGQLHIEVTLERMKRKFNAEVRPAAARASPTRRRSRAAPRSRAGTRSRPAAAASSATAGSRSSRCRAAAGFEFVDKIFGGSIPRNFIPSVEKGVRARARARRHRRLPGGGRPGERSTTARTTRSTRRTSPSSSPGRSRPRRPCCEARPCLLEPIMNVEVTVPSDHRGRRDRRPQQPARQDRGHGAGRRGQRRSGPRCRWRRC